MKTGKYIMVFSALFIVACKKTKLEGDLASLIGEWEWRYTLKGDNVCTPVVESDITTHSPSIDGYSYSLVFQKKGKLIVKKNGKKERVYRLTYQPPYISNVFSFYLDNNKKKGVVIIYKKDSGIEFIHSNYFPQELLNGFDGCQVEQSFFYKLE